MRVTRWNIKRWWQGLDFLDRLSVGSVAVLGLVALGLLAYMWGLI